MNYDNSYDNTGRREVERNWTFVHWNLVRYKFVKPVNHMVTRAFTNDKTTVKLKYYILTKYSFSNL
jgi:hypothetical protein